MTVALSGSRDVISHRSYPIDGPLEARLCI